MTVLGEFQRISSEGLVALKKTEETNALLLDSFVPETDLAATYAPPLPRRPFNVSSH